MDKVDIAAEVARSHRMHGKSTIRPILENAHILTCIRCGSSTDLIMILHGHTMKDASGWVFCCTNCLELVFTGMIGIMLPVDKVDTEKPVKYGRIIRWLKSMI